MLWRNWTSEVRIHGGSRVIQWWAEVLERVVVVVVVGVWGGMLLCSGVVYTLVPQQRAASASQADTGSCRYNRCSWNLLRRSRKLPETNLEGFQEWEDRGGGGRVKWTAAWAQQMAGDVITLSLCPCDRALQNGCDNLLNINQSTSCYRLQRSFQNKMFFKFLHLSSRTRSSSWKPRLIRDFPEFIYLYLY